MRRARRSCVACATAAALAGLALQACATSRPVAPAPSSCCEPCGPGEDVAPAPGSAPAGEDDAAGDVLLLDVACGGGLEDLGEEDDFVFWDDVGPEVEVVFGALAGHDDVALGLELDDGQLLVVRLPARGDAGRERLLATLATALEGDRLALRVRWEGGYGDGEPTLEAFVGGDEAAPVRSVF